MTNVYGWIKKILILAKDRRTENKIKEKQKPDKLGNKREKTSNKE